MSPTHPRVVVTGATGFLGSHILAALSARPVTTVAAVRDAQRLPDWFEGEAMVGDLTDADYRHTVVANADVVIHAGTWSSFWGHRRQERELFLEPALALAEAAVAAGVGRFISASTVVLGEPSTDGHLVKDEAAPQPRSFWPHHEALVAAERQQRALAADYPATRQVSLRLGHFVGAGNTIGLASALVPRMRTRQVPWVDKGRAHLPLVSGRDMGEAFALAATVPDGALGVFEAINIVGPEQPTAREVFTHIANTAGVPTPAYSVPTRAAYAFGALMEALHPLLPGKAPFLTRSLVFVGENWHMDTAKARRVLGFEPVDDWREAIAEQLAERAVDGYAWPPLAQATSNAATSGKRAADSAKRAADSGKRSADFGERAAGVVSHH